MDYNLIYQEIITKIIPNQNNEITADVLRPILIELLNYSNDKIGDLNNLNTADKTNVVNSINEVINMISNLSDNIEIFEGLNDPNVTPPASFKVGDMYSRETPSGSKTDLYIYTGVNWYNFKVPSFQEVLNQGGNINVSLLTNDAKYQNDTQVKNLINGLDIVANQASSEIYLKNSDNVIISTISVGFLNNEGTTFKYNPDTKMLELWNDQGEKLSEIPVSDFVSNALSSANWNSGQPKNILNFKDNEGNTVFSVTYTMENIGGLLEALEIIDSRLDSIEQNVVGKFVRLIGDDTKVGNFSLDGVFYTTLGVQVQNGQNVSFGGNYAGGAPTISGSLTGDGGIYFYSNGNISGQTFLQQKNGFTKIGSGSPVMRLDVDGQSCVRSSLSNTAIIFDATLVEGRIQTTTNALNAEKPLQINPDGGNVVIGGNEPRAKLDVRGSIIMDRPSGELSLRAFRGNEIIFRLGSGTTGDNNLGILQLFNGNNEDVRLYSAGDNWIKNNLGLGNSSPQERLDVTGNIRSKDANFETVYYNNGLKNRTIGSMSEKPYLVESGTDLNTDIARFGKIGGYSVRIKGDGRISGSDPEEDQDFVTYSFIQSYVKTAIALELEEKNYLREVVFTASFSNDNWQSDELIGSKIVSVTYYRANGTSMSEGLVLGQTSYSFNQSTGTLVYASVPYGIISVVYKK